MGAVIADREGMSALDMLIPTPRQLEIDTVDLALPQAKAWELVRHADLGRYSPFVRALFAIRTLPSRVSGKQVDETLLRIDDLSSTPERPGFQLLVEDAPNELVVGAIGKVWHLEIPFVHVASADDYADFSTPDYAKVAWAIRVVPLGERDSRIEVEVRVDTTDEASWAKFRRYYRLIGPGSHFIRHSVLSGLVRDHGTPEAKENQRPLPGDELLPDASAQITQWVDVRAKPSAIWPWLVQMGGHRAGFYSIDLLDNENVRSAHELHPELSRIRVGDVLPATRSSRDGFEVLRIVQNKELIVGGLFDPAAKKQLPFVTPRPESFWQVTWAFFLEERDEGTTRIHARARAAFSRSSTLHAAWIRPAHRLMQASQLRNLAKLVEGRAAHQDWRDVTAGVGGAAVMLAAFLTPFMRRARRHWGLDEATANRTLPGDELIPVPTWDWTHGIEIEAEAERVWPWVAQIGADRGGFYSYQWLENLVGCNVHNAERIHPELALGPGAMLSLHPKMPPLPIALFERGSHFVAFAAADEKARVAGKPWIATSWGFYVEPVAKGRCRFISRYRCAASDDALSALEYGPLLLEPIGFAMDRRMLLGVKARVEEASHAALAAHEVRA